MTNELINKIKLKMQAYLGEEQMRQLHEVLCDCLSSSEEKSESKAVDLIQLFLADKEQWKDVLTKQYIIMNQLLEMLWKR